MLTEGKVGVAEHAIELSLWNRPDDAQGELEVARTAGFTWIKQQFGWRDIEPDARGQFGWLEADRIVQEVNAAGFKLVVHVDNQPRRASSHVTVSADGPPESLSDFTAFLQALSARYRGRINVKGAFDVLGVDAAGFTAPACMDPQQVAEDPTLTHNDQTLPVDGRRVYAFRHVEDVRGIMADRGDGNKPIAILHMDDATQAEAFACAQERWSPWIGFITVSATRT